MALKQPVVMVLHSEALEVSERDCVRLSEAKKTTRRAAGGCSFPGLQQEAEEVASL